jgi:predicted nucleic acid-binding protein
MTPVLVDTSLWVDHLSRGREDLADFLRRGVAMTHPWVVGELACGGIRNRDEVLGLLQSLPTPRVVDHAEALVFIEAHNLMGLGLAYVDIHLLASCVLDRVPLWTRDKALGAVAQKLGVAFDPDSLRDASR